MNSSFEEKRVIDLAEDGILRVEDGNHGEYRPRTDEFEPVGTAFIRAADMDDGQVLFGSASSAPLDSLLSHKGTVGKVAFVRENAPPFVC